MIYKKSTISFHLIMLSVLIYPLYFSSFGINKIDRNIIEIIYFLIGFLILTINIIKNNTKYYLYLLFSSLILMEYIYNPFVIYNYAPNSMVASSYGIVGNYGILFFFLVSNIYFFTHHFTRAIEDLNLKFYIMILSIYFMIYSSLVLLSFYINFGTFFTSVGINGHSYHLAGIAMWIYLLMRVRNEPFSVWIKLLFLYNFLLLFFIFKTRGILFLDLFLLLFAFTGLKNVFLKFTSKIPMYKLLVILSFFIIFIFLFVTNSLTQDIMIETDIPILSKNGAGQRDFTILQWVIYLMSVYFDIGPVFIPEITPHSTYIALLGSHGILYTLYFLWLIIMVFIRMYNKNFFIEFAILMSGFGIYFAVAVVSPVNFFYYVYFMIIFYRYGTKLTHKKTNSLMLKGIE